jgi:hypothetical protein
MSAEKQDGEARLQEAGRAAIAREERTESPRGEWRERLWYPAPEERRACCESITPTEANRQALESHCRTQAHVAQLFDVPLPELRRTVKRLKRSRLAGAPPAGQGSRHPPFASPGGRAEALFEVSRGAHGDARQELRDEARSFERILPRLIAAAEAEAGFLQLLDEAAVSIERLKLTLEYCRKVEETFDSARSVREMVARLFEDKKPSA